MSQADKNGTAAGSTAEKRSTGMQICRPTTAKIRSGEVVITLPRACQDVQYRRYIAITSMVTFIPEGPHLTGGKMITARSVSFITNGL